MHAEKLSVSVNTIELSTSYGKMANLATGIAATIGGTSAQTQSRAVSLDMTESLAVVALFSYVLVSDCSISESCASVRYRCIYWRLGLLEKLDRCIDS